MPSRLSIIILVLLVTVAVLPGLLWISGTMRLSADRRRISATAAFPMTVTDVRAMKITLPTPPKRIVSLAPNNTEILFAIGAGDRVVADTSYCDYPPEAAALPKVGGYLDPNVEKVLALEPDLVLATRGTSRELLDRMTALKLPVICLDPASLPEMLDAVRFIGRVTDAAPAAAALAARLEARYRAVTATVAALPEARRPSVLFLFSLDELYSVGPGSHIDAMITDAGGRNIAAAAAAPWPQLSMERVLADDPEVIVVGTGGAMSATLTDAAALQHLRADRRWRGVRAVKTGRVAALDGDDMTLPAPRMVDGLEALARALHPTLFSTDAPP
ncbi:MAG TPA: helical backbone metal receptor [Armatimonadota bacterium]|nr:helical backbone metal receptor [Armatimonadota bacterium]